MPPPTIDEAESLRRMTSTPRDGSHWRVALGQAKEENKRDGETQMMLQRKIHRNFPQLSNDPSVGTHMLACINEVIRQHDLHGSIESLASQPGFGSRLFFSNKGPYSIILLRKQFKRRSKGEAEVEIEWVEINIMLRTVTSWFPIQTADSMENFANPPIRDLPQMTSNHTKLYRENDANGARSTSASTQLREASAVSSGNLSRARATAAGKGLSVVTTPESRNSMQVNSGNDFATPRETDTGPVVDAAHVAHARQIMSQALITATHVANSLEPSEARDKAQIVSQERTAPISPNAASIIAKTTIARRFMRSFGNGSPQSSSPSRRSSRLRRSDFSRTSASAVSTPTPTPTSSPSRAACSPSIVRLPIIDFNPKRSPYQSPYSLYSSPPQKP